MQIMSKYYKLKEIALTRILFDCVRFYANPNRNNGNNFKGYDRLKVEISVMKIEKLEYLYGHEFERSGVNSLKS
jgi:hypothetical protein